MRTYEKYKESGIEWIGEIPEHWELTKLKYIGKLYSGLSGKSGDDFKQDDSSLNKPFIPFTNIANNEKINPLNLQYVVITEDDKQNKVQMNDLFFMMSSENFEDVGKSTILVDDIGEVYLNSFCKGYRLSNENVCAHFLNYFLLNHASRRRLMIEANGFTRINLKMEKVNDFEIELPPLSEQTAIANYLDSKTTEIDRIVADKEALVSLYEEEKKALINEAVTKGRNPEVKLKPSGIDWLGDVPEHWEVVGFNHFVYLKHGFQFREYDFTDDGIKVVKITQLKPDGSLDISNCSYIDKSRSDEFDGIKINNGDILMALTGGTIGKIIKATDINELLLQNYRVGNFYPKSDLLSKEFLFYILSADLVIAQIFYYQKETGQPNVGKEDFSNMKFCLPPLEEQTSIVHYIESETANINDKINQIKQEIALLKEYRQALIFEAVTGKVRVFEGC